MKNVPCFEYVGRHSPHRNQFFHNFWPPVQISYLPHYRGMQIRIQRIHPHHSVSFRQGCSIFRGETVCFQNDQLAFIGLVDVALSELGVCEEPQVSVAAKKGTKMAAKWSPAKGAVRSEPFPLLRSVVRHCPEPSRGR